MLEFLRSDRTPTRGARVVSSSGEAAPRGERDSEPVSVMRDGAPSAETTEKPEGDGMGVSQRVRCGGNGPVNWSSRPCGRDALMPEYGSKACGGGSWSACGLWEAGFRDGRRASE